MPSQSFRVKNSIEVGTGVTISSSGNITAGVLTATSFVGSGSQLTNIVANYSSVSGVSSYASLSGISSSVVGGAVSATSLTVTGVSTFEGAISIRNGYNLNIGDNNDLRIYNDGTDSRIEETGLGLLKISGSSINIEQHSTNETIAKFIGGGAVELYHNDSKKLETTGAGVTVTGTTFTNQLSVSGVSTFVGNINVGSEITTPRTPLQVERYGVGTTLSSWTASSGILKQIDSISTDFQTTEYTLHFTHSTGIQSQKVLVMHNGTTAYSQEYAIMSNPNLLVSVGSSIFGGNLTLNVTPESGISGIITYRFTRQSMI